MDQTDPSTPATAATDTADRSTDTARPSWRDRLGGLRGALAVSVAAVIIGGAGGAALGTARGAGQDGPGRRGGHGGPGGLGTPRGPIDLVHVPGRLPPSTAAEQQEGTRT